MNSFGLGLVLNFVDNASAKMNVATSNFLRMSATADSMTSSIGASASEISAVAYSLGSFGNVITDIGNSIISVFTGITNSVISTGGQMYTFRRQLTKLYDDAGVGNAKIQEAMDFSAESNFNFSELVPAMIRMKTAGVEAMQEITTASGEHTQSLLSYAADFASMGGDELRNMYGTGINAVMGSFKEYIAEGNTRSMTTLNWDVTGLLGEEKGKTAEERAQQLANLAEKLGFAGYAAELAGTPMQRLSNIQDILYISISRIAESGVYDTYTRIVEKLSNWVFSLYKNEELLNSIISILTDTVSTLLAPLESMLDWVIANSDAIVRWIEENPKLVKNILLTIAAVGAFLTVGGSLLKLLSSIAFATSGLQVFKSLPALLGKMVVATLPFIAVAGLAYTAWDNNLGGIQDKITWFINNIGDIFSILTDAWGDNTLSEEKFQKAKELGILPFIEGILQLKYYWDFFVEGFKKGFTSFFEGLLKGLGALGIDVDGLGEKFTDFLKSLTQPGAEDQWVRIGEAVGALIAGLATLALAVKVLTPVFKLIIGISNVVLFVGKAFKFVWGILKKVGMIFPAIIVFFKDFGAAISLMKEGFGFFEVMGAWFPKLAGVFAKIGGFFSKFGAIFAKIGGIFTKFGGWIVSGAKAIGAAIMSVLTAVAGFLGLPVWAVVAIIVAITAVISLIVIFWDEIKAFFAKLWDKIVEFSSWLWEGISSFFSNVWGAISGWFSKIFSKVKEVITKIVNAILENPIVQTIIKLMKSIFNVVWGVIKTIATFIAGVAKVIWSVIKLIGTIIAGVAKVVWAVISGVVKVIWSIIKGLFNFIVTVVTGIWKVIKAVANFIWTLIKTVAGLIMKIINVVYQIFRVVFLAILAVAKIVITGIVNFFKWLWGHIKSILTTVKNFFSKIFTWVKDKVIKPVVDWIVFAFNWVKDKITSFLTAIGNFFSKIFNWINDHIITPFREFFGMVFDWIADKVTAVTDWFKEAFDTAAGWIKDVFQGVSDFFTGIWEAISDGAKKFFDWIAEKLGWVTDALSAVGDFFGGILDGVGGFFSGIGDGIANFIGLDTGGYVKTTGIAVLHPNEVVVNDDTTKRLQNFLSKYENDTLNGLIRPNTPHAVLNNIYPTVMEAVPVTTVPAEEVSNINNTSSVVNNTQNYVQTQPVKVVERAGETHNDYSVTFQAGSVVIQLNNASDAELEKAAEKLMKIIARKQQLKSMVTRT